MVGQLGLLLLLMSIGLSQQQEPGCEDVKFMMYYGYVKYGGEMLPEFKNTFYDCLFECENRTQCLGVSYERVWKTCFIHSEENRPGSMLKDNCCLHARKACMTYTGTTTASSVLKSGSPTPYIEVGREPPPTYKFDNKDQSHEDSNIHPDYPEYPDSPAYPDYPLYPGNSDYNNYHYYDYDHNPPSVLPTDAKESEDGTEDNEINRRPLNDLSQSDITLPTTLPPTTPKVTLLPTTVPSNIDSHSQDKSNGGTSPSRTHRTFEKFSSSQIHLLLSLGIISLPELANGLQEEENQKTDDVVLEQEVNGEGHSDGDDAKEPNDGNLEDADNDDNGEAANEDDTDELTDGDNGKPLEDDNEESVDEDETEDGSYEAPPDNANTEGDVKPETASTDTDGTEEKPKPELYDNNRDEDAAKSPKAAEPVSPNFDPGDFVPGIRYAHGRNYVEKFLKYPMAGPPGMSNIDLDDDGDDDSDEDGDDEEDDMDQNGKNGHDDDDIDDNDKGDDLDDDDFKGEDDDGTEDMNMAKTTPPSLLRPPAIPDSGICPDPFERIEDTAVGLGVLQEDVEDVELCKKRCLLDDECRACDFNEEKDECYLHFDEVLPENIRDGDATCCTHYRKTQCANVCYQHIPINMANSVNENAECIRLGEGQQLDSIQRIKCPGLCGLAEVISISADGSQLTQRLILRMCNTNPKLSSVPGCETTTNVSPVDKHTTFTLTCSCKGIRCNALGTVPLMALQLHLPMDHTAEDTSPHQRHGIAYNVSYSNYDSQMINGAEFNGSACIKVRPLIGFLYGSLQAYELEKQTRLTITMWVKRNVSEGVMALLSNGHREGPIDIYSIGTGSSQIIAAGLALTDGNYYVASAEAPLGEWVFIAMVITHSETSSDMGQLELYVGDDDLNNGNVSSVVDIPAEPLSGSSSPLYIGAKASHGRNPLDNYFVGTIDEVMMFSDALVPKHLQAVRDMARDKAPEEDEEDFTEGDDEDDDELTTASYDNTTNIDGDELTTASYDNATNIADNSTSDDSNSF